MFSTSSATVRCISCRRRGGMQLLLDTWGPPGIWCRSDRSLECPQTAPHHSPRSGLMPLGLPGCGQYKYYFILDYHCLFQEDIPGENYICTAVKHGSYNRPMVFFNIKPKGDTTELFWKVIWMITWWQKDVIDYSSRSKTRDNYKIIIRDTWRLLLFS